MAHSNVCKSTPARAGSMLASIIGTLHFGQAGRSIAANGMTEDGRSDCGMIVCTEKLIRVDEVMESPKLAE